MLINGSFASGMPHACIGSGKKNNRFVGLEGGMNNSRL